MSDTIESAQLDTVPVALLKVALSGPETQARLGELIAQTERAQAAEQQAAEAIAESERVREVAAAAKAEAERGAHDLSVQVEAHRRDHDEQDAAIRAGQAELAAERAALAEKRATLERAAGAHTRMLNRLREYLAEEEAQK